MNCIRSAEKRSRYEVEGCKDRVNILYHLTSADAAKAITNTGRKMLPGKGGMFGGGIYFAESVAIAQ